MKKKIPKFHIKFFDAVHYEKNQCISTATNGKNLIIVEYGLKPLYFGGVGEPLVVEYTNDCFGGKSSIIDYYKRLKSGKIKNIDNKKTCCINPRYTQKRVTKIEPIPIEKTGDYWARLKILFKFKENKSGLLPYSINQNLSHCSSLLIYNEKEHVFFKSNEDLNNYRNWYNVKKRLKENDVMDVKKLERFGVDEKQLDREIGNNSGNENQLKILQFISGALKVYPWYFGDEIECLKPTYLITLINTLRGQILNESSMFYCHYSIIDKIKRWNKLQEDIFLELYKHNYFRPRIGKGNKRSIISFWNLIENGGTDSIRVNNIGSEQTLYYYCGKIQDSLEDIHEHFINGNAGLESELVYNLITTKKHLDMEQTTDIIKKI